MVKLDDIIVGYNYVHRITEFINSNPKRCAYDKCIQEKYKPEADSICNKGLIAGLVAYSIIHPIKSVRSIYLEKIKYK